MRRAHGPPDGERASVVRLPHPGGASSTLERAALARRVLGVTAIGAIGTVLAAGNALGVFGWGFGGAAAVALLANLWFRGRTLEVVVAGDGVTFPSGLVLPRGKGHLLVESLERKHKGALLYRWNVSHSGGELIAPDCAHPLVVRAAVEGLAMAGGWPVVWRSITGDDERREVRELDTPLHVREARQPTLPVERRRPAGALYDLEEMPEGGTRLRYVGGWRGRTFAPGFGQLLAWSAVGAVALTVFGLGAAALVALPVLLVGPLLTPDVEVTPTGVTLRHRIGRLVVRTRRWLASEVESLYLDTHGRRLVAAGDRFHKTLGHARDIVEAEWLRAVVVRALIGDAREPAPVERRPDELGPCPACAAAVLERVGGELDEHRCPTCAGRFLPQGGSERLVETELGITRDMLRELTRYFAGEPRACPSCRSRTSAVRLKGVTADLCQGCGGLWLDAGELAQLSAGRYQG